MSSNIDYQRFRRDETCVEEGCRARKFYIEDGKKFCQRGHEQTGFTQTQQDEDDWNAQGKKSRKKREEKSSARTILRGGDARELYLQCYQLVLWKQCHWLVSVKGLPKELETIVRDLWGLRLGFIHRPQEERSGYSSGTGTTMFSSTSEGENTDTDGSGFKSVSSRRSKKSTKREGGEKLPKLVETLALVYLGMLLMRLPISLGEISKWVTRDEILYNRAIKEVPNDMRAKLPKHFQSALEVRSPFNGNTFRRTILRLVDFFHTEFDLVFPPLNIPLLLFKHMRDLSLPIEIYPAVYRLSRMLKVDFSYPILQQSPRAILDPEFHLIVLIVIATKLSQPFDNLKRFPTSDVDPSALKLDWDEWREIMQSPISESLERGKEMEINDNTVMALDGKKIDDYLDWFQRMWLDDRDQKMPETILDKFPLSDIPPLGPVASDFEERLSRLKRVQQSMVPQELKPVDKFSNDVERPGDQYRRYRNVGDIPEKAIPFFGLVAKNLGIHLKLLVQRVYEVEGGLMKWNLEERRGQVDQGRVDSVNAL